MHARIALRARFRLDAREADAPHDMLELYERRGFPPIGPPRFRV